MTKKVRTFTAQGRLGERTSAREFCLTCPTHEDFRLGGSNVSFCFAYMTNGKKEKRKKKKKKRLFVCKCAGVYSFDAIRSRETCISSDSFY